MSDELKSKNNISRKGEGIALCLSGGGFRAMLFHSGSLWRLNELGFLPKIGLVSSVSGGSIISGVLATHWPHLTFDKYGIATNLFDEVILPIRSFAEKTKDVICLVKGLLNIKAGGVALSIANLYEKNLFGKITLQDIPDFPRFVFNATNLQSGVRWRFSKDVAGDFRVGYIPNPQIKIADAVAASSAFPPYFSPAIFYFDEGQVSSPGKLSDLHFEPYTRTVFLTDGGVYDNLGLQASERDHKTIFVSDGGQKLNPISNPNRDWFSILLRSIFIIDSQVSGIRRANFITDLQRKEKEGVYWGIKTNMAEYNLSDALPCPFEKTQKLAEIGTRLKAMDCISQEKLINWGYAITDAAIRRYYPQIPRMISPKFPYNDIGIG